MSTTEVRSGARPPHHRAGGRCKGAGRVRGLALRHCPGRHLRVPTAPRRVLLAPCPAALRAAGAAVVPGHCGAAEPQPAACLTHRPPPPTLTSACQGRASSGIWCEWVPGAVELSQTTAEAGGRLFSWRKGGFALLFLFPGLVGAPAPNRGSLSSGAGPAPRGVVLLPKPRAAVRCGEPLPTGLAGRVPNTWDPLVFVGFGLFSNKVF